MRRSLLPCAALSLVAACQPASTFSPADDDAVRAVLSAQRDAWNAGDLDGYMAGYERSDALVFTSGGQIRRGFDVTQKKYRDKYGDDPSTMGHLEFELDDVRSLGPDAAVVLGHWALSETPKSASGVFSVVLVRGESGWKVVHDHTSSEPSPVLQQG